MNPYEVVLEKRAEKEMRLLAKSGRKADLARAVRFVDEVAAHPHSGTGDPERLRHHEQETWSRTVNRKDRFMYEIYEEEGRIVVKQALGHYADK